MNEVCLFARTRSQKVFGAILKKVVGVEFGKFFVVDSVLTLSLAISSNLRGEGWR